MTQKASYHAISKPDINSFNAELKKYVDLGYEPTGGISVSICRAYDGVTTQTIYSILLMEMIKIEG